METRPWFTSVRDLHGGFEDEWAPEAYTAAEAIRAAEDKLGPLDLIMFDLHTNVATRFVAMSLPGHRHDQNCGRA